MDYFSLDDFKRVFTRLKVMADGNKQHLIELDSVMGDGDLGLTMAAVFTAANDYAATSADTDIGSLLMKVGMMMARSAPSTMGTLMATGFMRGGKALKGLTEAGVPEFHAFWTAFVEGIMERGKAKPGDKTIVDALHPVSQSFTNSMESQAPLGKAFLDATEAAWDGVKRTENMVAQHGRAAYYQEKSRTVQDPGATVGALVVEEFSNHANEKA